MARSMAKPEAEEIERRYTMAVRALDRVRTIVAGNQNRLRDDYVNNFLSAVYSVVEYLKVSCGRLDKSTGAKAAKLWVDGAIAARPLLGIFRKLRDVDQHLFTPRILHRQAMYITARAFITTRLTWHTIRRNGLRFDRTLREAYADPRMSWLRNVAARFSKPQTSAPARCGYSWGFSASGHNAQAPQQHQLTTPETVIVDNKTAAELFTDILADVRSLIDDAKRRGFI